MPPLPTLVQQATQRAMATGALRPIESRTVLLDSEGVRFIVRAVSSLQRKEKASEDAAPADPLGAYEPGLFVTDLAPAHYLLLNKFPLIAGHLLIVTRHFEPQQRLLGVDDFAALAACLSEIEGLGFYNGGTEAGASQPRKHLQFVPLPLSADSGQAVPMERALVGSTGPPFAHAFARVDGRATATALHALYRKLLHRCGISAIADSDGEAQSAPYNLLVRRGWMLAVPRSRASFDAIPVNGLGFAGTLFVRSEADLERIRNVGAMQVLRAVALPA